MRTRYPKHPVRAAIITFVALLAFVGVCALLMQERTLLTWSWAVAYCAFLSVGSIGLIRLGPKFFWRIGIFFFFSMIPAAIGMTQMLRSTGSIDMGERWLQVSLYLLYAVAAVGLYWVVKGWLKYFEEPSANPLQGRKQS